MSETPIERAEPPGEFPLDLPEPELKPSHGCLIFVVAGLTMLTLAVAGAVVGMVVAGIGLQQLGQPTVIDAATTSPPVVIISTVAGQVGLLVVLLVPPIARLPFRTVFGWRHVSGWSLLLAGIGCVAFSLLGDAAVAGLRALGLEAPSSLASIVASLSRLSLPSRVAIAIGAALLPACCEELLFRGVLFTAWQRRWGPTAAVLVTSLLFGLIHLDGVQSVSAAVMGLYLGLLRHRSGSVWPCMAAHAANNAVAGVVLFSGGDVVLQQSLGLLALVGGAVGLLALRGVRRADA